LLVVALVDLTKIMMLGQEVVVLVGCYQELFL
jgi:hypothetical protein